MEKELILMPSSKYNQSVTTLLKDVSNKYSRVCYVSLNKTYKAMLNILESEGIDAKKYYFMDFITPTLFKSRNSERCVFLDSFDLSEFADKFLNLVKMNSINAVVFDSISSFLVYKTDKEVRSFFDYVLYFLEELDVSIILYGLKEDSEKKAIKQMKMRVDKTVGI